MINFFKINNYLIAETDNISDIPKADIVKVILPSSIKNEKLMQLNGFSFADRTIAAIINTDNIKLNLNKYIRIEIENTKLYKEEIENIALNSFPYDRRFHVFINYDDEMIASFIIKKWINDLDEVLVAKFKDKVIGFLALKKKNDNSLFIHLAAVEEKYRLTGAALSLYSKTLQLAIERGYKYLEGRISTKNMSVMNLYSFLGARFETPMDIYLKEYNKTV